MYVSACASVRVHVNVCVLRLDGMLAVEEVRGGGDGGGGRGWGQAKVKGRGCGERSCKCVCACRHTRGAGG